MWEEERGRGEWGVGGGGGGGGQIDPPVGQIDTPQKKLPSKSPALFRLITSPQVRRRRPKQLM